MWTPLALDPEDMHSRTKRRLSAMGRLKPGRTAAQAAAEIDAIGARLARQYPDTNKNRRFWALPVRQFLIGPYTGQYVLMLFGAVLFVLLIACANVANLQFARRHRPDARSGCTHRAGSRPRRLVAQLLTESVLLSLLGAALGLLVASWGLDLNRTGMPPEVEKHVLGWKDISLNGRALSFTAGGGGRERHPGGPGAGVARFTHKRQRSAQGRRPRRSHGARQAPPAGHFGSGRDRAGRGAAGGAGLMVRGFQTLAASGERYEPATMLTLELEISENKYREGYQQARILSQVLERASAIPGVRSAVAVSSMPYNGQPPWRVFTIEGQTPGTGQPSDRRLPVGERELFRDHAHSAPRRRLLTAADGANSPRGGD